MAEDANSAGRSGDGVPETDVRDLIGDPEPAPASGSASVDSPGTADGHAGTGGDNKVQDELDR